MTWPRYLIANTLNPLWLNETIWVRSQRCGGCLVTWFCYQLIAKPSNKTAAPLWPDPYDTIALDNSLSPVWYHTTEQSHSDILSVGSFGTNQWNSNHNTRLFMPCSCDKAPGGGGGGGGGGGALPPIAIRGCVPLYRVDFERPVSLK